MHFNYKLAYNTVLISPLACARFLEMLAATLYLERVEYNTQPPFRQIPRISAYYFHWEVAYFLI